MSVIDLGRYGMWRRAVEMTPELAAEAERLGYGAVWIGGSPSGRLDEVERCLEATEAIPVATGIVNMWREPADLVAESFHRVEARFPGRFLLGLGIGHPEATKEYASPLATMVSYLDRVGAGGVPPDRIVLAALGPKALSLAADRTAGAHPYLTGPRHTEWARGVMGPDPLLAPTLKVVLGDDAEAARAQGRENIARYLQLVNYRSSLLREGWTEADLADGGSDVLVDTMVAHGAPGDVARAVDSHLVAGAGHVCIQVLGDDPIADHAALAGALWG
jgi:probable F420-dependent oxidoreductase